LELKKYSLAFATIILCYFSGYAQKGKKQISFKDSLDGKFDLSDYVIDAHGFIPIASIITEPSLGGFGLVIAPIFIKKRPPYVDSVNGNVVRTPVQPDITGGAALYTANKTWGTLVFRSGTLIKSRIKYMVAGGYVNVNMSFYKTFPELGEKEMKFNIKTMPILLQGTRRIGFSKWYAGLRYLFLHTNLSYVGDKVMDSLGSLLESKNTLSQLSGILELDNRDNIFTPDRGMKLHLDGGSSNKALGSDYDFWKVNYYAYMYTPVSGKLIGGWRIDGQQTFGDVPFYLLPYLDMRGLPIFRYQGKADLLTELEARWDFVSRWSLMFYSGVGKAFDEWSDFGSAEWVATYGTGFRYLIARKFKLRMGIDVAKGPETWAYYIVFGSSWLK
jgi:Omp85 superfamily domain